MCTPEIEYYTEVKDNNTTSGNCNCGSKKTSNCGCSKKVLISDLSCATPLYFLVNNYFSELVHEWEKDAARYNLGVKELEEIEYKTETNGNNEILTKVIFKYRKGHELITREFVCAPKGDKGDKGDPGIGVLGNPGPAGQDGKTPTLNSVIVTWVENASDEGGLFELVCDTDVYNLKLKLQRPNAISELLQIITSINTTLTQNYVSKSEFTDTLNTRISSITNSLDQYVKKTDPKDNFELVVNSNAYGQNILNLIRNNSIEGSTFLPNTEFVLQTANDDNLGGIKTGYHPTLERYYGVEVDGAGRAFVKVPWRDTLPENIDIRDWKPTIEAWQNQAVSTLRSTLEAARNDVHELKQWRSTVFNPETGTISTIGLDGNTIVTALEDNSALLGLLIDSLHDLNVLILQRSSGETASFILALNEDGTVTAITSDDIVLNGRTIADEILALDLTLTGTVKATKADITGDIAAEGFILKNKTNSNIVSYYENEDTITLKEESDHRIIYVFTGNHNTNVKCNSFDNSSLAIKLVNGDIYSGKNLITLDKNSLYIIINASFSDSTKSWYITKLDTVQLSTNTRPDEETHGITLDLDNNTIISNLSISQNNDKYKLNFTINDIDNITYGTYTKVFDVDPVPQNAYSFLLNGFDVNSSELKYIFTDNTLDYSENIGNVITLEVNTTISSNNMNIEIQTNIPSNVLLGLNNLLCLFNKGTDTEYGCSDSSGNQTLNIIKTMIEDLDPKIYKTIYGYITTALEGTVLLNGTIIDPENKILGYIDPSTYNGTVYTNKTFNITLVDLNLQEHICTIDPDSLLTAEFTIDVTDVDWPAIDSNH